MGKDNFFDIEPFSLGRAEKSDFLNKSLSELTKHHYQNCMQYKRMIESVGFDVDAFVPYPELPYLPVRLFKMHDLYSVDAASISKTMTSSGTSGQQVSKIFVDKESLNYLKGSLVDYSEDGLNQGIKFHNPNAKAVCGCGESFTI